MATGGVTRLYEEDDKVDEYLLNQVSKWVLYHRIGALARDLGISQAQFTRIIGAKSEPEEQIFQVISGNLLLMFGFTKSNNISLAGLRLIFIERYITGTE